MALLTVQKTALTGVTPTFVAVATSDTFANDGKTYIEVKNAGATQDVVTITAQSPCNQGTLHDSVTTVPITTGDKVIGPFEPTRFNSGTGLVTVNHSFITSVTCAVVSESA